MDDMDYYEYEENKKRFTPKKIARFIFKLIAYSIIIATFVLIIGRIQLAKLPKSFTQYVWTDASRAAYEDGEIELIFQEPYSSYDENGYYNVSNVAISPESGEVQFTVRYNSRSTINSLMQFYGMTERPTGEVFVYILSDQSGKEYTSYTFAASSRPMYEFRRVIFDGVDLEGVETLYLDVYYGDDVSKNGRMNSSFVIFDTQLGTRPAESVKVAESPLSFSDAPAYVNRLKEN